MQVYQQVDVCIVCPTRNFIKNETVTQEFPCEFWKFFQPVHLSKTRFQQIWAQVFFLRVLQKVSRIFRTSADICESLFLIICSLLDFICKIYYSLKWKVKEYQRQLLLENVVYLFNIFDIFLFFTTILTCFDTNLRFFLKNVDF